MTKLPPVKLIKDVLDGLLGRDVTTTPADLMTSTDAAGGVLAVYADDRNALQAVVGWDLPAAVRVGAAVGLVPPAGAADAVAEKFVPANLLENLGEVSNVLASVFQQVAGNPHLRLVDTYCPVAAAPDDATGLMFRAGNRIDLDLDVPGYGRGRFALSMMN
jgi:hypothetical protein